MNYSHVKNDDRQEGAVEKKPECTFLGSFLVLPKI